MEEPLQYLARANIDEELGGCMEDYFESHPVTESNAWIFERFLQSSLVSNRDAALRALIVFGKRTGYDADAVLLHYQGRDGLGSPEEFAAIDYLRRLRDLGSVSAQRVLQLLDSEPYVRALYGDTGEPEGPIA